VPRSAKRCSASRKRHLQSRVALGFVCGPACNSSSEAQARLKPYSTRNVPSELRALRLSRKLFLSLVRLVVTNYESAILTALSTSIRMLLPERRHYSIPVRAVPPHALKQAGVQRVVDGRVPAPGSGVVGLAAPVGICQPLPVARGLVLPAVRPQQRGHVVLIFQA